MYGLFNSDNKDLWNPKSKLISWQHCCQEKFRESKKVFLKVYKTWGEKRRANNYTILNLKNSSVIFTKLQVSKKIQKWKLFFSFWKNVRWNSKSGYWILLQSLFEALFEKKFASGTNTIMINFSDMRYQNLISFETFEDRFPQAIQLL